MATTQHIISLVLLAVTLSLVQLTTARSIAERNGGCMNGGYYCSASVLYYCQPRETPNSYKWITLQECRQGNCNTHAKKCIPDFYCQDNGLFPDPYDYQRYYNCTLYQSPATPSWCSYTEIYDVKSKSCRAYTGPAEALESYLPVPECLEAGKTGTVPGDPNIFYVCTLTDQMIETRLYKCEDNELYIVEEKRCVAV